MFWLINENNERFSLKDFQNYAFIPKLSGVGYKHNLTYVKVGVYYKTDNKEIGQGSLSGTAVFSNHDNYRAFIDFVEDATSLRFINKPADVEYFRDIDFEGITNAVDKITTYEAEMSFFCKSLYYTSTDKRFEVVQVDGYSQYPLLFDYTFNDYASTDIFITNNGHTEAEMVAEFWGYIENPSISLYQDDVLIYTVSFDKTLQTDEKLIYSARDGNNYIIFEATDGTQTNALSTLSLESDNFFKIPKGTSKIVVNSDSGIYTKIVFQIISQYKGV